MRILKLLEAHHQKLAQIIRAKDIVAKRVSLPDTATTNTVEDPTSSPGETPPFPQLPAETSERPSSKSIRKMAERRDSSPALAKDMASRRGIPQTSHRRVQSIAPNVSPLQAIGKTTDAAARQSTGGPQAKVESGHKDMTSTNKQALVGQSIDADGGFSRFYSNLTSGPLSKLSSMLAFTGLPLMEDGQDESTGHSKAGVKTSVRATTGPDVKQIFSKAALRAIEEQQRSQGFSGNAFGPGESFYMIPTSGGTASYANILTRAQCEEQRQHGVIGSDEFEDARETAGGHSPLPGRGQVVLNGTGSVREEELQIENATLKQILDKLSHRLQEFESHAQDASMAALNQSLASVRTHGTAHNQDSDDKVRAMEVRLENEMKQREALYLENQKQEKIIAKYRNHWEDLKKSARAKDKAKREKAESAG